MTKKTPTTPIVVVMRLAILSVLLLAITITFIVLDSELESARECCEALSDPNTGVALELVDSNLLNISLVAEGETLYTFNLDTEEEVRQGSEALLQWMEVVCREKVYD